MELALLNEDFKEVRVGLTRATAIVTRAIAIVTKLPTTVIILATTEIVADLMLEVRE